MVKKDCVTKLQDWNNSKSRHCTLVIGHGMDRHNQLDPNTGCCTCVLTSYFVSY